MLYIHLLSIIHYFSFEFNIRKVMKKNIIIICNKKWEFIAFTNALNYYFFCLPDSEMMNCNLTMKEETQSFTLENLDAKIKIYCLQDYLTENNSETNSKQKYKVLSKIFISKPDLTISIGTGTSDCSNICNGSVLVGGNTCVYNPFKRSLDESLLAHYEYEIISKSNTVEKLEITNEIHELILKSVLRSPNVGGNMKCFEVDENFIGLSVTNVVNFDDYSWADIEAVNAVKKHHDGLNKISLDTTHGIIRWFSSERFLFFTGITNRIGKYKIDFEPNYHAQGYVAAFNCGVVFKFLLQDIMKLI